MTEAERRTARIESERMDRSEAQGCGDEQGAGWGQGSARRCGGGNGRPAGREEAREGERGEINAGVALVQLAAPTLSDGRVGNWSGCDMCVYMRPVIAAVGGTAARASWGKLGQTMHFSFIYFSTCVPRVMASEGACV